MRSTFWKSAGGQNSSQSRLNKPSKFSIYKTMILAKTAKMLNSSFVLVNNQCPCVSVPYSYICKCSCENVHNKLHSHVLSVQCMLFQTNKSKQIIRIQRKMLFNGESKILIFLMLTKPYGVMVHSNRRIETIRMNGHTIG